MIHKKKGVLFFLRKGVWLFLFCLPLPSFASSYHYQVDANNSLQEEIDYAISIRNLYYPDSDLIITLDTREYNLLNCSDYCIHLEQVSDVTIRGAGVENTALTVNGLTGIKSGIFKISDSKNISVEEMSLNYEYKPFFQGEVTYKSLTSDNSYLIAVNPIGSKLADASSLLSATAGHATLYDSQKIGVRKAGTGTFLRGNPNISYNPSNNRFYFNYPLDNPSIKGQIENWVEIGDHFVYTARESRNAIKFERSVNIGAKNIVIHASPGGAIVGVLNSGQQLFDNIEIKPESGYIISSNADGFHMQDSISSITVQDSHVESTGDDGLAIYNTGTHKNGVRSTFWR